MLLLWQNNVYVKNMIHEMRKVWQRWCAGGAVGEGAGCALCECEEHPHVGVQAHKGTRVQFESTVILLYSIIKL